jgi:uncharacterized membrane protein YoaK (UPF0700 family)
MLFTSQFEGSSTMQQPTQPRPNTPNPTQERRLIPILLLVTLATGVVEAVSYFHLGHIFVAYVTGTIILFGAHLVGVGVESPAASAVAIASFLIGGVLGGRLVRRSRPATRILADILALDIVLLLAAVLVAGFGHIDASFLSQAVTIALLGLAMGSQMSATRHVNVLDLVIPAATSIVHGLAHDSWLAGGQFLRGYRRAGVVLALLTGAAAGAGLAALAPWVALLLAMSLLALATVLAYRVPEAADAKPEQAKV